LHTKPAKLFVIDSEFFIVVQSKSFKTILSESSRVYRWYRAAF